MNASNHLNDLISDIRAGKVVLWVGSGFSKYAGYPIGSELSNIIKSHVPNAEKQHFEHLDSLENVAQEYETLKGSRAELIAILQDVLKNPKSRECHELIVKIPQIKQIITTNYDTLFEETFGDHINVIYMDEQIPTIIANDKVNLFKIHGDISHPETILITKDDYIHFFSTDNNGLLWNEITSLASKYSILFIGYSIDDINIKYILDKIIASLSVEKVKMYLILPKVPEHKQTYYLNNYGIRCIDMSAEEAIPYIQGKIEENLIIDTRMGNLGPEDTIKCLDAQNVDAEFITGLNGTIVSSVSSRDGRQPISVNFGIRNFDPSDTVLADKIHDLYSGELVEDLTLSHEVVDLRFQPKIGKILLLNTDEQEHVTVRIQPQPSKEFNAILKLQNSGKQLINISAKSYVSKNKAHIKFVHPLFTISFFVNKDNRQNGRVNIIFPGFEDITQANIIYRFLFTWFEEEDLIILDEYSNPILSIPSRSLILDDGDMELIGQRYHFISQVDKIQTYFDIKMHIEAEKISENDLKNVEEIARVIDGQKFAARSISMAIKNMQFVQDWCDNGVPDFHLAIDQPQKFVLFGFEFSTQQTQFEGKGLFIENLNEVKELLSKNADMITITLKSKNGTIEAWYNSIAISKWPESNIF